MQCTGAMATTTTATGCVWSFHAAAGVQEAASAGSAARPEADTGLHPDAQSTGSLCRVSMTISQSFIWSINKLLHKHRATVLQSCFLTKLG